MRPLPRLLAFADDRIAALDDLGMRAAAIAAAGPAVALVARRPQGTADQLAALALRFAALAAPPMAPVYVTARSDVAAATGAQGIVLRRDDLDVPEVRRCLSEMRRDAASPGDLVILRSVHTLDEAADAVRAGADGLIVGAIWPTPTHPDRSGAGTSLLQDVVGLGLPVFAIGGVTADRAAEARRAGAWGVAAIRALWDAERPYHAARELIDAMSTVPCN